MRVSSVRLAGFGSVCGEVEALSEKRNEGLPPYLKIGNEGLPRTKMVDEVIYYYTCTDSTMTCVNSRCFTMLYSL